MSNYLDDDDDLGRRRNERELTLSTGSILGIFFGLALICALFFGFGYNMGRKSSPSVPVSSASDSAYDSGSPSTPVSTAAKPSAGSFTNTPAHTAPASEFPAEDAGTTSQRPTAPLEQTAKSAETSPAKPQTVATTPRVAPTTSVSFGAGNFVVQVAAVSHQEDADLLVSALHRKGYTVAARSESGDKLVHIQIGPFSDHKEADAMKAKLLSDGYNAMIKQL